MQGLVHLIKEFRLCPLGGQGLPEVLSRVSDSQVTICLRR